MKRLSILLVPVLLFLFSCQEKSEKSIEGTWQMYKEGKPLVMNVNGVEMHRSRL